MFLLYFCIYLFFVAYLLVKLFVVQRKSTMRRQKNTVNCSRNILANQNIGLVCYCSVCMQCEYSLASYKLVLCDDSHCSS